MSEKNDNQDILNELDDEIMKELNRDVETETEEETEYEDIHEEEIYEDEYEEDLSEESYEEAEEIPDDSLSDEFVEKYSGDFSEEVSEPLLKSKPPKQKKQPVSAKKSTGKKKKKKKKRSRVPGVLILVTLIFGVSIISSLVIIGYGKDMLGIGKSDETHLLVVPENATTEEISQMLVDDNIIMSAKAFKIFADLRGVTGYLSGEHFLSPNMAYETLITKLTELPEEELGESVEVTFPEGVTLIEASYILEANEICDAEDFVFYFNSGGFGVDFENLLPIDTSLKFERMEGYLFPDTYFFYQNSDVESVCQKIYYNFDVKMTEERLLRMRELGLNLDQLITFASIVQQEAATTAEMPDIASVFWNRLNNPDIFPLLQSDPTSNYSSEVVRPNMEYYNQTIVEAYDTYKSPGLPPGAICNPGIEAIDAVLEAKETDYFYFIANINTKETYFSSTLEEHEYYQDLIDQQYAEEAANNAE